MSTSGRLESTNRKARASALCLAGLSALALGACGPGADKSEPQAAAKKAASVAQKPTVGPEKVTLNVQDHFVGSGQEEWIKEMVTAFEAKYPQVTVRRNKRSFGDDVKTQRLALSGGKGPDVVHVANGWSGMGPLVRAGLLVNLDKYSKSWGWDKRFTPETRAGMSFTSDGKAFGSGSLYGAPTETAITGVYYNKAKLKKLGVEYPKTIQEFEDVLKKAKAAGETPIQGGDLDKWPFLHVAYMIINQFEQPKVLNDWIFKRDGGDLNTPGALEGAKTLRRWAENDYFAKGVLGKKYEDGIADFNKGDGVFFMTGSWVAGDVDKALKEDAGFAALPPKEAGGTPSTTGGYGNPFSINAKSKNIDVASAWLDFLSAPEAQQALADSGQLPAFTEGLNLEEGTLLSQVADVQETTTKAAGLTEYFDFATPKMLDTAQEGIQRLMAGEETPEALIESLQEEQAAFGA